MLAQLFSYTSDVLLTGANFSSSPGGDVTVPLATNSLSRHNPSTKRAYLHVVDRLRTLRTWLVHLGGTTPVVAYVLPAAAPRVPTTPSVHVESSADMSTIGPEFHGEAAPDETDGHVPGLSGSGEKSAGGGQVVKTGGRRLWQKTPSASLIGKTEEEEEQHEVVNARSLASGALVAIVLHSRLQGPAGPGILVVAGVALSGLSFLTAGDALLHKEPRNSLWAAPEAILGLERDECGDEEGVAEPRALGMRGLLSGTGDQQALALVWAERPSFQLLDVGRAGLAGIAQEIPLYRRHR